jgi:hypothetical protein
MCFSLLAASIAHADEAMQREADLRFKEGLELADKGRDEEARVKFAQAYALGSSPSALLNLARTEQISGHTLDALRHWKEYARLPPSPKITPAHIARAKQAIAELSKVVGHIAVDAPPSVRITLDGTAAGETPLAEPLDVLPGKHTVQARDQRADVEVRAGEIATVHLLMQQPQQPAAAPPLGSSSSAATTSSAPSSTSSGGTTSFWTTRNTTGIVLGGVALGATIVGVGFVLGSNSASDKVNQSQGTSGSCSGGTSPACSDLAQAISTRDSDANVARVMFVGAGIFALASVATFVFWPERPSKSQVGFTPLIFPGGAAGRWSF